MNPIREHELLQTRRQLFGRTALGLGTAAMASLLSQDGLAQVAPLARNTGLHHAAKAKRVIYLFMSGGPSHLDLWDYKPKLKDLFRSALLMICGKLCSGEVLFSVAVCVSSFSLVEK